jgi:hypothetical protein
MATFLISYELAAPHANKHDIANAIMVTGDAWARALDQTWYVRADAEACEVEAMIEQFLGDDDALLVQAVEDDAQMTNTTLRWFKRRGATKPGPTDNVVAFPNAPATPVEAPATEIAA